MRGLPPDPLVFVRNHLTPAESGHMVSWYRRWPQSDIIVFYLIGSPGLTEGQAVDRLTDDLNQAGATISMVHHFDHWRYFPHVATETLADGYDDAIEQLQGANRTWYVGELLSFPTVEHVAAYSKQLIQKHF